MLESKARPELDRELVVKMQVRLTERFSMTPTASEAVEWALKYALRCLGSVTDPKDAPNA